MKVCTVCKQSLPTDLFYKDATRPRGVRSACKACTKASNNKDKDKQKAYYRANREARIEYGKAYYLGHKAEAKVHAKRSFKKAVDNLDDAYIKHILVKFTSLKRNDIPQALVDLKRLELAIKRKAMEIPNEER